MLEYWNCKDLDINSKVLPLDKYYIQILYSGTEEIIIDGFMVEPP